MNRSLSEENHERIWERGESIPLLLLLWRLGAKGGPDVRSG